MRRPVTLVGLLQAAAVLTIFFSLVTAVDIPFWGIELFTHFRLQYLAVSGLLLIAFLTIRKPAYAGVLLLTTAFNAWFVVPWYLDELPQVDGHHLKLVHANVRSGNTGYQRLIDFVVGEDPDVIVLQEVNAAWVSGTAPLREQYPFVYTEARQNNFGIAVYSKTAFDSVQHVDSPPFGYPTIVAHLSFDEEQFALISSHPTVPLGASLFAARNEQLESIADLVNAESGKVMLLGDFNTSLWCPRYRALEAATGLVNTRRGAGILPSWPTFMPFAAIPIDHALVSEGIGVVETRIGAGIGSDHLPLVVTISL